MLSQSKKYVLLLFLLLLIGCRSEKITENTLSTDTQTSDKQNVDLGYPVNETQASIQTSYPVFDTTLTNQDSYPIREIIKNYPQGPDFKIDEPLSEGDMQVAGTGPANVPIILVDVSEIGLFLDDTIINEDGTFIFEFQEPLESGHSIGIQLGDIEGTDLDVNDFLYNDNYYERPLIGILFDMVVVN